MSGRSEALRGRLLTAGWRALTRGRSSRVWVDAERYAELLAGAARAEALEREIEALVSTVRSAETEAIALRVLDSAGVSVEVSRPIAARLAAAPPLLVDGSLDGGRVTDLAVAALARVVVEELLAEVLSAPTN